MGPPTGTIADERRTPRRPRRPRTFRLQGAPLERSSARPDGRRIQAPAQAGLRRDLRGLRRVLPGAHEPVAGDPRHPARVPRLHQGAARHRDDRAVDRVRRLEVPDGLGVRPQQSPLVHAARLAALGRRDGFVRPLQGHLRFVDADHPAAGTERVVQRHGMAAQRQDHGALVQRQRARARGVAVEHRAQRRRRAGRCAGRRGCRTVRRLGRQVLLQRDGGGGDRRARLRAVARFTADLWLAARRGVPQ